MGVGGSSKWRVVLGWLFPEKCQLSSLALVRSADCCIAVPSDFSIVKIWPYHLGHKKRASVFLAYLYFFYPNLKNYMSFVERIKLSNQILHPHFSIFFRLGIRVIIVLKMGIENSSFFFIHCFHNNKAQRPTMRLHEFWGIFSYRDA